MKRHRVTNWERALKALVVLPVTLLFIAALSACSGLLDVENESDLLDEDLNTEAAIGPVVNGVAGDFGEFYSSLALAVGQAAFELWHTGSHGHDRETDEGFMRRPSSDGNGGYNRGSRAYWVATDAQRRILEAYPDGGSREEMAEVLVWGGFTLLLLGENWCGATFDGGPEVQPNVVLGMAEDDFTRAIEIATAAGATEWRQRATAGRARARLMLGNHSGAIADAAGIPAGFRWDYNYSNNSGRENNDVPGHTRDELRRETGVHPKFFEDDRYWNDPRTPMNDWGPDAVGPDAIRRWVEQDKYPKRESDMPITTWQEARLMEAEAEIRTGDLGVAVDLINEVRASWELDPYTGAMTEDAVMTQLRYERSAELWIQAHALNDLRRFNDPSLDVPPGRGGGLVRDRCWEVGEDEYQINANLSGS
jgi:hypothetical protein